MPRRGWKIRIHDILKVVEAGAYPVCPEKPIIPHLHWKKVKSGNSPNIAPMLELEQSGYAPVEAVRRYTEGMSFEDFAADRKTVDAVIRNLIIIGEAATHVPDDVCLNYPEISWYEMRGMRNFVVHEYFGGAESSKMMRGPYAE